MEPVDNTEPILVQSIHSGIRVASSADNKYYKLYKPLIFILKSVAFSSLLLFILCLPLGDPQETCTVEICKQDSLPKALAYSYVCNVYRAVSSTMKFSSKALQDVSETTGCLLLEAAHEAKIKFYSLLSVIDPQDLCRIVCCKEELLQDMDLSQVPRDNKNKCKCRPKCCGRKKQQLSQTL